MSLDNDLLRIMLRIEKADIDSPMAVFKTDKTGFVDAVFANTVFTQQRIASNDPDLIGVFGSDSNMDDARQLINNALLGKAEK
jgi:hypothetical protein